MAHNQIQLLLEASNKNTAGSKRLTRLNLNNSPAREYFLPEIYGLWQNFAHFYAI